MFTFRSVYLYSPVSQSCFRGLYRERAQPHLTTQNVSVCSRQLATCDRIISKIDGRKLGGKKYRQHVAMRRAEVSTKVDKQGKTLHCTHTTHRHTHRGKKWLHAGHTRFGECQGVASGEGYNC